MDERSNGETIERDIGFVVESGLVVVAVAAFSCGFPAVGYLVKSVGVWTTTFTWLRYCVSKQ